MSWPNQKKLVSLQHLVSESVKSKVNSDIMDFEQGAFFPIFVILFCVNIQMSVRTCINI